MTSQSRDEQDPDDDLPLVNVIEQLRSKMLSSSDNIDDSLSTESAFDYEWEADLIRELTGKTLPDSDDDETDTESETAAEPGSDMNYFKHIPCD